MPLSQRKIWALLDERQGNTSQTIGVAEALGLPFEIKQIEFNEFIRIPNILINNTAIGIRKTSREQITPPWPDIVISTARRLGIVASYIKSCNPGTFIAQIQWPGWPASHFDFIATPKHDNVKPADNLFVTVGAPHRVTTEKLAHEAELWRQKIANLSSPRIAVLVGGNSGSREFSISRAKELVVLSSKLAESVNGSLLVTTSRRTSTQSTKEFINFLTADNYFHDWNNADNANSNPFYGFLGLADAVIVTGDSISMCSEACATGKPVYIYSAPDFVSPKHQQFIDELLRLGLAKRLMENGNKLFTPPSRLDDASIIAKEIARRCRLA